jgi:hypothetical protein
MSDSAAAALVTHVSEIRPGNTTANNYVPTTTQLSAFYAATPGFLNDQLRKYVTGRPGLSNPSTDDLIQWAAHKWGIPEDWVRAQAAWESHWTQAPNGWGYGLGDKATVTSAVYPMYPVPAQISASSLTVYQSMGLMQCKWLGGISTDINAGTEPLRWQSTAFNLDYYAHYVRWLYDGYTTGISWIPNIYKGNGWQSIGGWYGGGGNAAAQQYIASVQNNLANRVWAQAGF